MERGAAVPRPRRHDRRRRGRRSTCSYRARDRRRATRRARRARAAPSRDADLVVVENLARCRSTPPPATCSTVLAGRRALLPPPRPGLAARRTSPTSRRPATRRLAPRRRSTNCRGAELARARHRGDDIYEHLRLRSPAAATRDATRAAHGSATRRSSCCRRARWRARTSRAPSRSARALGAMLWILGPSRGRLRARARERCSTARASTCAAAWTRRRRRPRRLRRGRPGRDVLDVGGVRQSRARVGDPPAPARAQPLSGGREIERHGFRFFGLDDVEGIDSFLVAPDEALLEHNLVVARRDFNLDDLPSRLSEVLAF